MRPQPMGKYLLNKLSPVTALHAWSYMMAGSLRLCACISLAVVASL